MKREIIYPEGVDAGTRVRTERFIEVLSEGGEFEGEYAKLVKDGVCVTAYEAFNGERGTLLHRAAEHGNCEAITALLDGGVDVDIMYHDLLITPLCDAAFGEHVKAMSLLLERGADVSGGRGITGNMLLSIIFMEYVDVLKLLVAHGVDVNARDYSRSGMIPLLKAVTEKYPSEEMISLLVSRGANIYAVDWDDEGENGRPVDHHKFRDIIKLYKEFYKKAKPPGSVEEVYKLLAAIPPEDPAMPFDMEHNVRKIFLHAKWESREQAEGLLRQLRKGGEKIDVDVILQKISFVRGWRDFVSGGINRSAGRGV